jgi:hypothetical protein
MDDGYVEFNQFQGRPDGSPFFRTLRIKENKSE